MCICIAPSTYSIVYVRVCCHSNETRAPIANLPNSAQVQGTPYHSPKLHLGACVAQDRHTHRRDQIHFTSATPHGKCSNHGAFTCLYHASPVCVRRAGEIHRQAQQQSPQIPRQCVCRIALIIFHFFTDITDPDPFQYKEKLS